MTRGRANYMAPPTAPSAVGYSVEHPAAGHYRMRLVKGGPAVGVRVWHGPPHDPHTGEEMDRSWRWQAEINGEPADIGFVWPACGREPIPAAEYAYLTEMARWAQRNAPASPAANPRRKIDLIAAPLPI
jgi:hypothetical protein